MKQNVQHLSLTWLKSVDQTPIVSQNKHTPVYNFVFNIQNKQMHVRVANFECITINYLL